VIIQSSGFPLEALTLSFKRKNSSYDKKVVENATDRRYKLNPVRGISHKAFPAGGA
jgi:hypothetical protein